MERLERLQEAMRGAGFDALLLGGEAAGQFAAGHTVSGCTCRAGRSRSPSCRPRGSRIS